MFNKQKDELLAAQAAAVKAQAETMSALVQQNATKDQEIADLRKNNAVQAARVAQLEAYLKDLGVDTAMLETQQFWWPLARKAVTINVDRTRISEDPSFANDQQRDYVAHLATAIMTTAQS